MPGTPMRHAVYECRQTVWTVWLLAPVPVLLVMLTLAQRDDAVGLWTSAFVGALHLGLLLVLGRFTVAVGEGQVAWHFGYLGRPRWQLPLADITAVDISTSSGWDGWGIRSTKTGMLYNASGLGAVRLTLRDGRSLRLGSAEPERLAGFIRARVGADAGSA